MKHVAAVLVLMQALPPNEARAGLFDGLFFFSDDGGDAPPLSGGGEADLAQIEPGSDAGVCISAIRDAEKRYGIPQDLLMSIGMQEAGMGYRGSRTIWPWSINADGSGFRFDSRAEAEAFLSKELAAGTTSIDVGCLQVNLRWHPDAFTTPEAGLDPVRNADYAARFLSDLYAETGDWLTAAGRYHSATAELADVYRAGVERQLAWLDGSGSALDVLGRQSRLQSLAPGVTMESPAGQGMNPLRSPVRNIASGQETFRHKLVVLPATEDMPTPAAEVPPVGGSETLAGWDSGSFYAPPPVSDEQLP